MLQARLDVEHRPREREQRVVGGVGTAFRRQPPKGVVAFVVEEGAGQAVNDVADRVFMIAERPAEFSAGAPRKILIGEDLIDERAAEVAVLDGGKI
ncbi:MAG: hypothetical protein SFX18_14745 [Pirellulales bacterium]|nr:hypothetical protein [Pirellulales bacterium]